MAKEYKSHFVALGNYFLTLGPVVSLCEILMFWRIWYFYVLHDCGLWDLCWAVSLLLYCKPVSSVEGGE